MPEIEFGFNKLEDEIRTLNKLISAFDKSIEGSPARFKIFSDKKGNIRLLGSSNGMKKFISDLLKHYVNIRLEKETRNQSLKHKKIDELVHKDSPIKIAEVSISSSNQNNKWIHSFIDWFIDKTE